MPLLSESLSCRGQPTANDLLRVFWSRLVALCALRSLFIFTSWKIGTIGVRLVASYGDV